MPIQGRRRGPSVLVIVASLLIPVSRGVRRRAHPRHRGQRARGGLDPGEVLFQVKAGDVLRLLDVAGDWLHVETADGRRGYVSKTVADVIAPAPPARTAAPAASSTGGTLAIDHKEVGCIVGDRYPRLDACFTACRRARQREGPLPRR